MSSLVLSAYCNYPDEAARPFVDSLLKTGYGGDYRVLKWDHDESKQDPMDSVRLRLFREYLRNTTIEYDFVMIADLRDVEFQSDPSLIEHSELDCYMEDDHFTLGSEPYNKFWIERIAAGEDCSEILTKNISCSGIMIGSQAGIMYYLDTLINFIDETKNYWWGIHQGAHNWLIYNEKLKCRLIPNESSPVYTVGLTPVTVYQHKIYNRKFALPPIIHQHDRHVTKL